MHCRRHIVSFADDLNICDSVIHKWTAKLAWRHRFAEAGTELWTFVRGRGYKHGAQRSQQWNEG
jgi:hypothetical protein